MSIASHLVDVLLEMHIVNPEEFTRRLHNLAASLTNPVAAKWFRRVPPAMVQNMDLLTTSTYTPEPKAWPVQRNLVSPTGEFTGGKSGSKYPFLKTDPEKLPTGKMSKDLIQTLVARDPGDPHETGAAWWNTEVPEQPPGGGKRRKVPMTPEDFGVKPRTPEQVQAEIERTGNIPLTPEDWSRWTSPAARAVKEALEEAEPYSTTLHQPYWQGEFKREFSPYTTKSKKSKYTDKSVYKGPPKRTALPDWIKAKEKAKDPGQTYFFNPIRVQQRDLWQKIENLVHFLNYMDHRLQTVSAASSDEEKAEAKEAAAIFKSMESMSNTDVTGFLKLLTRAQEHITQEKAIANRQSIRKVSQHGELELYALLSPEAIVYVSNLPSQWPSARRSEGDRPSWCTNAIGHATNYFASGQNKMYVVMKRGDPYMLLTPFHSANKYLDDQAHQGKSKEIAPLFINFPDAVIERSEGGLLGYVKELRRAQGLPTEIEGENAPIGTTTKTRPN